jgi:hypothetical protein
VGFRNSKLQSPPPEAEAKQDQEPVEAGGAHK